MSGIYIHIPFCKQACIYCNFHFKAGNQNTLPMTNAILKELSLRKDELNCKIETLYFGGGTPSILSHHELESIFNAVHSNYNTTNIKEITLEANPDDINDINLDFWKSLGVNRLSIGVQSFNDQDLKWMNRSHNSENAELSIKKAIEKQFIVNADLIFGLPDSTITQFKSNINKMLELGVHHLSCYGLTLEEKTAWQKLISLYKYKEPDEIATSEQFEFAVKYLQSLGWDHYEISNYCRDGHYAVHNTNYWKNKPYLGIGPSAHSYSENIRKWNVSDNRNYIESIEQGILPHQSETLSNINRCNEYIMTGLRTKWGFNIDKLDEFGVDKNELIPKLKQFREELLIKVNDNQVTLTDSGEVFADAVASSLFYS